MTRTDQDSWDLASSVGATATMVAAARALASEATNPIINDPFAAPLVRAVGLDFFRRLVDGEVAESEGYDGSGKDLGLETDSIAVRTRFFDDFFLNAARDGVRQAVILAAGLDARAYRLSWPPGSVVYEVDQPAVIEFKSATMSSLAAAPTAELKLVFSESLVAQFSGADLVMTDMPGMKMNAPMKMPAKATLAADGKTLVVTLPKALPKGGYKLSYHVVSTDTHRVEGNYSFKIN